MSERRPGELGPLELLRWTWRQLTSMRTALVLLFLLALGSIPGSLVPQANVDALATARWQAENPRLAEVYERLGLFSVYDSVWFSAIYLLLATSLVGCIVPRTLTYLRGIRAVPPRAPRNLTRLPDHTTYTTDVEVAQVHQDAVAVLRRRRYRVRPGAEDEGAVAAERGYLREVGNLVFHLAVLVVLAGFAVGNLFGYKGGVILVVGGGFANNVTQYDDFVPGSLFDTDWMEPFEFTIERFDVDWVTEGQGQGTARNFVSHLRYTEEPGAEEQTYRLRVNHPLSIGGTDLFLIGHGYAPVITVTDGNGDVAYSGPTVFLPEDMSFLSFGVVKAPDARPLQIGLDGLFYPSYIMLEGDPVNVMGDARNPTLSLLAYAGDLRMDEGSPQSVYVLDKESLEQVDDDSESMFRVDLQIGQSIDLPDDLGTVSFDGLERWNRLQISRTPGKFVALGGVSVALLGLLGSLFIRPRRVWVRARRENDDEGRERTVVEIAGLDRSGGGDVPAELATIVERLRQRDPSTAADGADERGRPT